MWFSRASPQREFCPRNFSSRWVHDQRSRHRVHRVPILPFAPAGALFLANHPVTAPVRPQGPGRSARRVRGAGGFCGNDLMQAPRRHRPWATWQRRPLSVCADQSRKGRSCGTAEPASVDRGRLKPERRQGAKGKDGHLCAPPSHRCQEVIFGLTPSRITVDTTEGSSRARRTCQHDEHGFQ